VAGRKIGCNSVYATRHGRHLSKANYNREQSNKKKSFFVILKELLVFVFVFPMFVKVGALKPAEAEAPATPSKESSEESIGKERPPLL